MRLSPLIRDDSQPSLASGGDQERSRSCAAGYNGLWNLSDGDSSWSLIAGYRFFNVAEVLTFTSGTGSGFLVPAPATKAHGGIYARPTNIDIEFAW